MAEIKKNQIAISIPTFKAIAEALKDKSGIDATNLINALSVGRNKDIVTVQVQLLFQGFTQEVDSESRYKVTKCSDSWRPAFIAHRYDYIATGVLDEKVSVRKTVIAIDTSNMKTVNKEQVIGYTEETTLSFEEWYNLPTSKTLSEEEAKLIESGSLPTKANYAVAP